MPAGKLLAAAVLTVSVSACSGQSIVTSTAHPKSSSVSVVPRTEAPDRSTTASPRRSKHSEPHPGSSSARTVFSGVTIGIDPGHNGRNASDPSYLNHQIWNGREQEACDTTGTETNGGYPEWRFTFRVSSYLAADLRKAGAHVVMTHTTANGVGPCVDRRARIIDAARAAVAIDIHADGGPPGGRGFAVLEPVPDRVNNNVVAASRAYARDVRRAFLRTGMPLSTYDGINGLQPRDDLAGLNLTTVPKVLIECGNMRNATDAAMLTSPSFQHRAARALMSSMAAFLTKSHG